MLKAVSGNVIFLGLSRVNIDRLLAGQPIAFDGEQIKLPGHRFCLLFGETEDVIHKEILDAFAKPREGAAQDGESK